LTFSPGRSSEGGLLLFLLSLGFFGFLRLALGGRHLGLAFLLLFGLPGRNRRGARGATFGPALEAHGVSSRQRGGECQ
jgi:hypothetical protein